MKGTMLRLINAGSLGVGLTAVLAGIPPAVLLIWGFDEKVQTWRVLGTAVALFVGAILALRILRLFYRNRQSERLSF